MAHSLCWFIICCSYNIRQVCTCIHWWSDCCIFQNSSHSFLLFLSPDPYHAVICSVVCWCMFLCLKNEFHERQDDMLPGWNGPHFANLSQVVRQTWAKLHSQGSKRGNGRHCHQDRSPHTWLRHVQDLCPRGGPGVRRRGVGPSSQRSACSKSSSLA